VKLHRPPLPVDRSSRRSALRPCPRELRCLTWLVLPARRLLRRFRLVLRSLPVALRCQRVPRFRPVPPFPRVHRSPLALRFRLALRFLLALRFRPVRRFQLVVLRSVPRFRRVLR
jgi:hypothetical protein